MSKSTKVQPSTAIEVRVWAETNGMIKSGQRGRLGSEVIKAFNQTVTRGKRYPLTYEKAPAPVVKHTAKAPGKAPVTRKINLADVRSRAQAAGLPVGKRGRLTREVMDAAVLGKF